MRALFVTASVTLPPTWTLISAELPTEPIMKAPPPAIFKRVTVVAPEL